ncbi:MAG: hypothetical protein M3R05_00090 [Chloroflexota bacterium]|nr:hypothetical protein [Chloroflexota bacterium]
MTPREGGTGLAPPRATRMIWVSDRQPGFRELLVELVPLAEPLDPQEVETRLDAGDRPAGLVIDGTQLLELAPDQRASVLQLPRVLICTGLSLVGLPAELFELPNVAILAKPFAIEDLESALAWVIGADVRAVADLATTQGRHDHDVPPHVLARPAHRPPGQHQDA